MSLIAFPVHTSHANRYVTAFHRHHGSSGVAKYAIGAMDAETGEVIGVAIVGRPVAIALDTPWTCEVLRLCTNGHRNACSFLYGACARAAKAMGYARIQSYILESEPGSSLKATGWKFSHTTAGDTWNRPNIGRVRADTHPTVPKALWYCDLNTEPAVAPVWPKIESDQPELFD